MLALIFSAENLRPERPIAWFEHLFRSTAVVLLYVYMPKPLKLQYILVFEIFDDAIWLFSHFKSLTSWTPNSGTGQFPEVKVQWRIKHDKRNILKQIFWVAFCRRLSFEEAWRILEMIDAQHKGPHFFWEFVSFACSLGECSGGQLKYGIACGRFTKVVFGVGGN